MHRPRPSRNGRRILFDKKLILPCIAFQEARTDQRCLRGVRLAWAKGIEEIVKFNLNVEELAALQE